MAGRVAGVAYVNVNGNPLPVRGSLVIHKATSIRAGIAGQDGVHGFSETPAVPAIELTATKDANISLEEVEALENGTVMAEVADGTVYTLRNAWKAGPTDLATAEGSFGVRFEGEDIQEFR